MRTLYLMMSAALLALSTVAWAQPLSPCDTFSQPDLPPMFYVGLGDAYSTQGRFADALTAYDCALEQNPDYADAYVSRGLAHVAQFDTRSALDDYNRAIELNPDLLAAYNNRALLYSQDTNYSLALADLNLLLTLDPDYAPAYHNRAMVHAAEGSYELAIADLNQAIAIHPDYAPAHSALGALYLALATRSYTEYERLSGRPAQYDATDTLALVLQASQSSDPSVWFSLQTPVRAFEDES